MGVSPGTLVSSPPLCVILANEIKLRVTLLAELSHLTAEHVKQQM